MHLAPALGYLAFEGFEIEIEMRQRMVLDGAGVLAQPVELRQLRFRCPALLDEAALDVLQRPLQLQIAKRPTGAPREVVLCLFHRGPGFSASALERRSPAPRS